MATLGRGVTIMTDNRPVPRSVVDAFYQAFDTRDANRIADFLDDDVEWSVFGPAEIMQVCGMWRGKAAVIDRFARVVPQVIEFKRLERECLLVDGDSSAMLGRVVSRHRQTGRIISHRTTHFVRYRDDKIISFRVISDSLDAAEQFIGHRIDLGEASSHPDLVAL